MYNAAPRADVGGAGLAGALMALIAFMMAPSIDNFDFNLIFGALGVVLPFLAGYMPKKWKTIYMSLVGIIALGIVALIEFLLTGTLAEATKSMAPPLLTALLVGYLKDPVWPDPPDQPKHYVEGEEVQSVRRRRDAR
jgi:peptidoglycan/LPS O-acetylase OafA/YrhL